MRLVTNGAGAVAGGGGYEPWGTAQPGTTGLGVFAFAGEQGDGESGLVALRARHYDPATGRFLQPDPAGLAGSGANLYAYAGGNPTNYVDPSGTFAWAAVVGQITYITHGAGGEARQLEHEAGAIADHSGACYSLRRYTLLASVCLVLCAMLWAGRMARPGGIDWSQGRDSPA